MTETTMAGALPDFREKQPFGCVGKTMINSELSVEIQPLGTSFIEPS